MAKYVMRKMNDLQGKGYTPTFPHLLNAGMISTHELALYIEKATSYTVGDVKGLLEVLSDYIANKTAQGHSVKLDGLGVFSATLGFVEGKEREEESGPHRNAASVQVRSIRFRPDRSLIGRAITYCHLERAKTTQTTLLIPTREGRLAAALDFIRANSFLRIADYVALTGLPRSTATLELLDFRNEEVISTRGRGTHKVYVAGRAQIENDYPEYLDEE